MLQTPGLDAKMLAHRLPGWLTRLRPLTGVRHRAIDLVQLGSKKMPDRPAGASGSGYVECNDVKNATAFSRLVACCRLQRPAPFGPCRPAGLLALKWA